jgi:hypothetical protein
LNAEQEYSMHKLSTAALVGLLCGTGVLASVSNSCAQSRTPPAGTALAQTPPIDQRAKQFKALPQDQKVVYIRQAQAAKAK